MLAEIRGWSEEDLYWELATRMNFLKKLVEEGATGFEAASKRIMEFYRERMKVMKH